MTARGVRFTHPHPATGSNRSRAFTGLAAAVALLLGCGVTAPTSAHAAPERKATSLVYVEVNSHEMANVNKYRLADGSKAFDVAIIFAANINSDDSGAATLHLNERVKWTLDNADTQIRPLQQRGTKVTLSLLGNHQKAGFANFPTKEAAQKYAGEVAQVVNQYQLDGVDLDDEWVTYGTNGVPAATSQSAVWLVESLREKLPSNSILSLYNIGATADQLRQAPASVISKLSYISNPHYGSYRAPSFPVDKSRLGAAAVNFTQESSSTIADFAQRTVRDGYGVFVTYNLTGADHQASVSAFTEKLYGQKATSGS
ncbi:Endo-beta-N-acetylglucosaminidase [Austwickia sp. TVS 96-490-7B]|uniref:endo-beta-N-acetylglucosaminidase H n=1 Tax=Austwickia sp. TVS 96-490-7B TaxID=2830843 RepID=UPI001C577223|nr:endo-beta-N-acetylglucosaminidase H [Austwickia sp. TVS 96-490-7B]MBW3084530.1 Endo-beta-N-acetylglucosaminidase [Austwickia sp. TVS 96-490-7B]